MTSTADDSKRPTSLVDLPTELLTAVCVHVAACPTIVGCRLVCRRLRDVIDASLELQYRAELARDGLIDTTRSLARGTPLTTFDRLARLRHLRKAWSTLSWTRRVTVPMPGSCSAYELVGGMFCKTQPSMQRGNNMLGWPAVVNLAVDGNVVPIPIQDGHEDGHVVGSRRMSLTWLPSTHATGVDPQRTVVRDDLGISTRDFAMDPSQDLMVLCKGGDEIGLPMAVVLPGVLELHVRTISTNRVHPEARVPVLCTPVLYPVTSVFVQIVDDIVGIMHCVDFARPRITIWNWKSGRLVVDRAIPPGTQDFSFIHSRALFVTTVNGGGTLEVFTFTCDPVDPNADARSALPSQAQSELQPLVHVATLCLPQIQSSVRVLSISTHTSPFLAACPPDTPFVSSNEARIHVVSVQYVDVPMEGEPQARPRMGVIVHHRALEKCLERGMACRSGDGVAPWTAWGPADARMVPHVGMFQWLRYVHGQRVVMLRPTSKAGNSTLQVLDFNVRRALNDGDTPRVEIDVDANADANPSLGRPVFQRFHDPSYVYMPNVYVDIVESRLPYREARRDVQGDYSGMMIDDERLIGLKNSAFLTGDMKDIDVFAM